MFFTYHKQKYKLNKNNQINNLILIARNQLIEHINYYNYFKLPIKNNKNKSVKSSNRYKYIRNKYLNKYSYMSINLHSLFLLNKQ